MRPSHRTPSPFSFFKSHRKTPTPQPPPPPRPQKSAPASYYRGGTSRALIFPQAALPVPKPTTRASHSHSPPQLPPPAFLQTHWAPIFRAAINSPDPHGRQLDGLGGGISSLSKVCVVGAPSMLGPAVADVDYTFAAVGVADDEVDFSSNCGNMTAAVGPFAVDRGLVAPVLEEYYGEVDERGGSWGETCVRIHNTNTGKIIHARFAVVQGEPTVEGSGGGGDAAQRRRRWEAVADGDFAIDGVAGTAARIRLDFVKPAGSKTGRLLPTGATVDVIDGIEATCVDVGNPAVFVRARDVVGEDRILGPDEIEKNRPLLKQLDSIRRQAGVKMGLARTSDGVPGSIPKISMVSSPTACTLPSGQVQEKGEADVIVRALSVGQPHKAIPITMALAVAAAAKLPGSIVNQALEKGQAAGAEGITIGHASGKIVVGATFNEEEQLESATVYRTARRLMEGKVYWKA